MMAVVFCLIPVPALHFMQRQIVEGLVSGATKGEPGTGFEERDYGPYWMTARLFKKNLGGYNR